ncbi:MULTISPECIES: hypothetical protein [Streptomyces]|uniref:hypothetical protein n=1 Tax=Streptomyces sp. RS2 TaxID=1451205 RepID=UPI0021F86C33|nr:hypothetical protein [Streptomyces sp. RS2]MCW1098207.1 hypothetical protein [Streptomyces sp. RS2]
MPVEYGPWGRIYDSFRRWQAKRHLASGFQPTPVPGRCEGRDRVGSERRFHGMPRPSARGWSPAVRQASGPL